MHQASKYRRTVQVTWILICLVASFSHLVLAQGASSESADAKAEAGTEETIKAYGRFVPERQDDFTWENDKVAFRIYGPSSKGKGQVSGVDAWLKKVPYSIIDKWYANHKQKISYHIDHGEGYDPYHVGDSRGIGGTAVWIDGEAWPAGKFDSYEVLENDGEKISFRVQYAWDTPLGAVTESKTITLALGEQLYQVNSMFTLDGEPAELPIAIGLTTHDGAAEADGSQKHGRIATSEQIDDLGVWTGALLSPSRVLNVVHTNSKEKDRSHIWLLTKTTDAGKLDFRAGFAWEAAGEITSFDQWVEYLDKLAAQ